jgi:hypothetical protein
MDAAIGFSPLLDLPVLIGLGALSLGAVLLALVMGASGWALRGLAAVALLIALANPSLKQELRDPLPDIAFLVVDESASQQVAGRPDQTAEAEAEITAALDALAGGDEPLEYRVVRVGSGDGGAADSNDGTRLLSALDAAAAEAAPDRIAGAILLTDGQAHDPERLSTFPGPVSALITGAPEEWDRRLVVETAPAFGLVGETVMFSFRIEALGAAPADATGLARVEIGVDGQLRATEDLPVGRTVTLEVDIEHGGENIVTLHMPALDGELTDRNNGAVLSINGVRDRLRVLLISGEPHAGERTWRNLLKADPSVDLVHFTILRPPAKQDGVPVFELSLISFPTRELFLQKIDEFDLIIFDRYRRRGVLPNAYIENVARYVREGGAVLVASGPAFAGVESLYRTPLEQILPNRPTSQVLEQGFLPTVSDLGHRHPVTAGLGPRNPAPESPPWGRWFRLIEMESLAGHTVMTGIGDHPLLTLDRVERGRVAMLASDHAWLWTRGFEGGGPQAELLRRLAHWLMKEPQLEEEALTAAVAGAEVTVERRSVEATPETLTAIAPSGKSIEVAFTEVAPGLLRAGFTAEEQGLYTLTDGVIEGVAAVGPPAPREFENPISTPEILKPLATATKGGAIRLAEAGTPDIRRVREGRPAAGRGWIGLARRDAYSVRDIRLTPLAPGWLMLVLSSLLVVGAWRIEGR